MTMGITSPTSTTGQILKDGTPVISFDANNNATFAGTVVSNTPLGMRNRIINGDMRIDQRNAGASVTATGAGGSFFYTVDRFAYQVAQASKFTVQQNAGSVTPPAGFTNYLGVTSSSSYSSLATDYFAIIQPIEGYNISDFAWGTANAKTVTLSFQVRSSLTGTFSGTFLNASANRTYPFTYTISSANTWTTISITISGETTGTWNTTNAVGIYLIFDMGSGSNFKTSSSNTWSSSGFYGVTGSQSVVGTNGATWYITGVQLEVGSTATPFERRLYGQELQLCQRYYEKSYNVGTAPATVTDEGRYILQGSSDSGNNLSVPIFMQVSKRTTPTFTGYIASTGASGSWFYGRSGASGNATVTFISIGTQLAQAFVNVGSAWVACYAIGHWVASAEL